MTKACGKRILTPYTKPFRSPRNIERISCRSVGIRVTIAGVRPVGGLINMEPAVNAADVLLMPRCSNGKGEGLFKNSVSLGASI